jgi:CheY-like chemotaxis protein
VRADPKTHRSEPVPSPLLPEVLIVEDEPVLRGLLTELLASEGYQVIAADDGLDAVSVLYGGRPSLVLLDLVLPRMNGLEVLAQIRAESSLADIPIVAMSAAADLLERAIATGADGVLQKPATAEQVVAAVRAAVSPRPRPKPPARA